MSDHVADRLVDLEAGRLSPEARAEVESHLQACEDCAAQLDWLRSLCREAQADGEGHLGAMRILELADTDGTAGATTDERSHLDTCDTCRLELQWAGELHDIETLERGTTRREVASRGWILLGLAAAAVLVVVFLLPNQRPTDLPALASVEPLPVQITRSPQGADEFGERRMIGLEHYSTGDFAGARIELAAAAALRADDEVALYLASAELLLGESASAADRLRDLADATTDGTIRDEALWQLAQAALLLGDADEAQASLRRLIDLDDYHAADAATLLETLEHTR